VRILAVEHANSQAVIGVRLTSPDSFWQAFWQAGW